MDFQSDSRQERRQLGRSDLRVSPVALGTWPMAGVTSIGVNDTDSLATLRSCAELGVNFIDTAFCYGQNGESEHLMREAFGVRLREFVVATKCGIHYNAAGEQEQDARPETIQQECEASLRRMGLDVVDLYYLHSPDPDVPIEESAGAIADLITAGKVRYAGISNAPLPVIQAFDVVCPVVAVQLPYNMLQRSIEELTVPWCQENQVAIVVYWALMKGLLAGRIDREHPLEPQDKRLTYPMYQGEEWEKNLTFLEELRHIAEESNKSLAQIVINWTIHQSGITVALCGAKRPWQFQEVAGALGWCLSVRQQEEIDQAITERGQAAAKRVFR